jgi:type I restriction enzyme S subunit
MKYANVFRRFLVAKSWPVTRLGDVARIKHGFAFSGMTEGLSNDFPVVVGIGNFDYSGGFRFESTNLKRFKGEFPQEYELSPGDVLMAMTCQTPDGEILGVPGRIPKDGNRYLHNQRLGLLQVNDASKLDEAYFFQFARTKEFNRQLFATASGSKILHTSPGRMEDAIIPLPPIVEQHSIAATLGALDEKIESNRRAQNLLDELFHAKWKHFYNSLSMISDTLLSDHVQTQYGLNASAMKDQEGTRFLRVTDINKSNWINWSNVPSVVISAEQMSKYLLEKGDLIVARMADPGKSAIFEDDEVESVFASYLVRLKPKNYEQGLFIFGFLKSSDYIQYAEGAISGSVQKNMNARVIVNTQIRWPEESALTTFASEVDYLRVRIITSIRETRWLQNLRDTLLPELLSGRIRADEVSKQLEEVL